MSQQSINKFIQRRIINQLIQRRSALQIRNQVEYNIEFPRLTGVSISLQAIDHNVYNQVAFDLFYSLPKDK